MLCTVALRLAISKGLHRQPIPSWNLTQYERSHWSCVFWAVYCLEKHIVCQSGRPSVRRFPSALVSVVVLILMAKMINDDDINCEAPTIAPTDSTVSLFYCRTLVSLVQLSSLVAKDISSVQAFRNGPETLALTVSELDRKFAAMQNSIQPILDLSRPANRGHLPDSLSSQHVVYLQYAYFSTLLDIHTALTCPWIQDILGLTQHATLSAQIERSTQIVAQACRDAILITRHIEIDASTPLL